MPRRTAGHSEAMREQILDGARRAFAAGGYRGTNVPAIAAEAGISVGLIYRYFPSKEELFVELCLGGTPTELGLLQGRLAPIEDPRARLDAAVDSYLDAVLDPLGAPLVLQALTAASGDDRIRTVLRRRGDDLRGFSAWFARDAIARGQLPADVAVEALALVAGTILDGALVAVAERGLDLDRAALRRAIADGIAGAMGLPVRRPGPPQSPPGS